MRNRLPNKKKRKEKEKKKKEKKFPAACQPCPLPSPPILGKTGIVAVYYSQPPACSHACQIHKKNCCGHLENAIRTSC